MLSYLRTMSAIGSRISSPTSPTSVLMPELVEDEAKFNRIDFYRISKPKVIFCFILSILTLGIIPLLCFTVRYIRIIFMYKKDQPRNAEHIVIENMDGTRDYINVVTRDFYLEDVMHTCKSFTYRLYEYFLDQNDDVYKPCEFSIQGKTYNSIHRKIGSGMPSKETYHRRLITYGMNTTDIPMKSGFDIFIQDVISPFYVFQLFTIIFLAVFQNNFIYSCVIFVLSAIILLIRFLRTRSKYQKLSQRVRYETEVRVYRPSKEEEKELTTQIPKIVSSTLLVPGDLIEISQNKKLPCDVILLSGACVMNESMLTGESALVTKSPLPKTDRKFDFWKANRHILFSGTECVETIKTDKEPQVIGVVIRTGFLTMKGRVIRSYLYSKEEDPQFYRDSLKYICVIVCIGIISFFCALRSLIAQDGNASDIIKDSIEIITIAVPPILPTAISLGLLVASSRLSFKKVVTKSEPKINIAGKVHTVCFNKTGILTENFLDLHGIRAVNKTSEESPQFHANIKDDIQTSLSKLNKTTSSGQLLLELIATCHSIYTEDYKLKGDALDLKLFNSLGWTFNGYGYRKVRLYHVTPPINNQENDNNNEGEGEDGDEDEEKDIMPQYDKRSSGISVIKRFAFNSRSQRISVISHKQGELKQRINIKGDPEVIKRLCLKETLPEDFDDVLCQYTTRGFKVMACATGTINRSVKTSDNLAREYFERDLEFLGLLIFENKLKSATSRVITHLNEADISSVMLTGDDPTTAVYTAKQCGIIQKNQQVVLGSLEYPKGCEEERKMKWSWISYPYCEGDFEDMESPNTKFTQLQTERDFVLDFDETVQRRSSFSESDYSELRNLLDELSRDNKAVIALTGDAFRFLMPRIKSEAALYKTFMQKIKVFAHSLPEDKTLVIHELQKQGNMVAMCGDDVSDCQALQAANVSIALSESEASLAASSMSKVRDISCVEHLLREGRCALVTSFHLLKFLSAYSLGQSFAWVILYSNFSKMPNHAFLYQEIFVVLPAVLTLLLAKPVDKISKQRPTEYMFSTPVIMTVVGECTIQTIFNLVALWVLRSQEWYVNPKHIAEAYPGLNVPDYDSTTLFLLGNIQYIISGLVFFTGKPFREPFYKNGLYTLVILITAAASVIILLVKIPPIMKLLEIRDFTSSEDFRWTLFGIAMGNSVATILYERLIVPPFARCVTHIWTKIRANKKA